MCFFGFWWHVKELVPKVTLWPFSCRPTDPSREKSLRTFCVFPDRLNALPECLLGRCFCSCHDAKKCFLFDIKSACVRRECSREFGSCGGKTCAIVPQQRSTSPLTTQEVKGCGLLFLSQQRLSSSPNQLRLHPTFRIKTISRRQKNCKQIFGANLWCEISKEAKKVSNMPKWDKNNFAPRHQKCKQIYAGNLILSRQMCGLARNFNLRDMKKNNRRKNMEIYLFSARKIRLKVGKGV